MSGTEASYGLDLETVREEKISGSRFIALASPLTSEKEFEDYLAQIRKRYPKATHYCYAYRLLQKEGFSDDGEPSRSAGMPLLELLRNRHLEEVALVVVRYFGGTKLGLGNLKRAYLRYAEESLAQGLYYQRVEGQSVTFSVDHASYEKIKKEASGGLFEVKPLSFGKYVVLQVDGDDTIITRLKEEYSSLSEFRVINDHLLIHRRVEHD
jgi:uncharacterized YigZ family protein